MFAPRIYSEAAFCDRGGQATIGTIVGTGNEPSPIAVVSARYIARLRSCRLRYTAADAAYAIYLLAQHVGEFARTQFLM